MNNNIDKLFDMIEEYIKNKKWKELEKICNDYNLIYLKKIIIDTLPALDHK